MSDEEESILIDSLERLLIGLDELEEELSFQKSKRWINRRWVRRPIYCRRRTHGFFFNLFEELKYDKKLFFKYTRMDLRSFQKLLIRVKPHIIILKQRKDVATAEERLALTLRYLATGDEIFSLALDYRISETTIRKIIKQTCYAIYKALSPIYLKPPSGEAWKNIAKGFYERWNLPSCVGAVDGTHIQIRAPEKSGSLYFNYKKFYSINLTAVCDHKYYFTLVDVGAYGSESDGGVLNRSDLYRVLYEGDGLPQESPLPGTEINVPHYFVGDEAYRMTNSLIRPFPGKHLGDQKRIFNYRLSRGRRCIENAFGILFNRWGVFQKPLRCKPQDADIIVLACLCLHNFMMTRTQHNVRYTYCPRGLEEGPFEEDHEYLQETNNLRDTLSNYFMTRWGKVPWQQDYINRGRHHDHQQN